MKFILTVFSLLFAFNASAFDFSSKVVGVADGDTITVLYDNKQYKIRLLHIDCPESSQAFGTKAKQILSSKIFGKTVTVKWKEKDRYKRILGDIYIGQRWINAEMVQEGLAWHYNFFSKDATIAAAQTRAKAAKIGIWSEPNPTPPWDFRKGKGTANRGPPEKGTGTTRSSQQRVARSITATGAIFCPVQSSARYSQKQRPQVMRLASHVILRIKDVFGKLGVFA